MNDENQSFQFYEDKAGNEFMEWLLGIAIRNEARFSGLPHIWEDIQ